MAAYNITIFEICKSGFLVLLSIRLFDMINNFLCQTTTFLLFRHLLDVLSEPEVWWEFGVLISVIEDLLLIAQILFLLVFSL